MFLGTIRNAIGYSDEHIEIYLARGLTQGEQRLDANEFLTLTRVPLEEALAACRDGTISDVKTIIGLMWAEDYFEIAPAGTVFFVPAHLVKTDTQP